MELTVLGVAGSLVILGAWLLWRGWRGVQVHERPTCRRCGFDLSGTVLPRMESGRDVCPECGANLLRVLKWGARRRRTGMLAVGVLLLVMGGSGIAVPLWTRPNGYTWISVKPVWLLEREAVGAGTPDEEALKELLARRGAGLLSKETFDRLIEHGLNRQADTNVAWSPLWGDLLEEARVSGAMTPAQRTQYAANLVQGSIQLRARVVEGKGFPYLITMNTNRAGSRPSYSVRTGEGEITLEHTGGEVVHVKTPASTRPTGWEGAGTGFGGVYLSGRPVRPGAWNATFRLTIHVNGDPVEWVHTQKLEVVPENQHTVTALKREGLRDQMIVKCTSINLWPVHHTTPQSERAVSLTLRMDALPMPVSFGVYAKQADGSLREWKLGTVTATKPVWTRISATVPADFGLGRLTLVLRPEPVHAEATVDIFEVWDGELVLPDIPVLPYGP